MWWFVKKVSAMATVIIKENKTKQITNKQSKNKPTQKMKQSLDGFSIVKHRQIWTGVYSSNSHFIQIRLKVVKSVNKTRNIAIGSSESCGSINKVIIALLQDEQKVCKTNTANFRLLCNILWTNSDKHCLLAINIYTMQISYSSNLGL